MKLSCIACFVAISFAFLRNVSGQAFVNLDFENATIVPDPSSSYYPYAVYTSDAIPGWAVTGNFLGPNDILYNDLALGAPSVAILGMNGAPSIGVPGALDGAFSIDLYGGAGPSTGVSITQTELVPTSANSLLFEAQPGFGAVTGSLVVSLGGQNISILAIATGPNYTLYGGNIPSVFAGQSEQLIFSALAGNNNYWEIDDIQFSTSSVPEPSTLGLLVLGGLLFTFRRSN